MSFESKTLKLLNDLQKEFSNYIECYKKIHYKKSMTYQEYIKYNENLKNKINELNALLKRFKKRLKIYEITNWL